jgi:hypothetical protein
LLSREVTQRYPMTAYECLFTDASYAGESSFAALARKLTGGVVVIHEYESNSAVAVIPHCCPALESVRGPRDVGR